MREALVLRGRALARLWRKAKGEFSPSSEIARRVASRLALAARVATSVPSFFRALLYGVGAAGLGYAAAMHDSGDALLSAFANGVVFAGVVCGVGLAMGAVLVLACAFAVPRSLEAALVYSSVAIVPMSDPGSGPGGLRVMWLLRGPRGVVSFQVELTPDGRVVPSNVCCHSPVPIDGAARMRECDHFAGGCWFDGSAELGDKIFKLAYKEGDEAIMSALKDAYWNWLPPVGARQ